MSDLDMYVGIDLGGTAIKLAFISTDGELLFKSQERTNVVAGGDQILKQMDGMIDQGLQSFPFPLSRAQIKGIGIGAPAFLNVEKGFVYEAVNLGWKYYPLKERLESITGLPVFVDNDANTAALGEMWKGAGEGCHELLCITLGTGVGGGVIFNGDIYHGARGTSGEIGHVQVEQDGYACNCGKKGCLETVASATGMVRLAEERLKQEEQLIQEEPLKQQEDHLNQQEGAGILKKIREEKKALEAKDIATAAEQGDDLAREVFDQVGTYLGRVLGNYAVMVNPGKIVIGGGVSQAGDLLFQPIRKTYNKVALPHLTGNIDIVPAQLGNEAGVIGAAWLVHSRG